MTENSGSIQYDEVKEYALLEQVLRDRRLTLPVMVMLTASILSIALALFHIFVAGFGTPESHSFRSIHVSVMLVLAIMFKPLFRSAMADPLLAADRVLAQVEMESDEVWLPFSTAGVEELIAADRHVFIDFTADWCLTCKVNEHTVLADDAVRAKFAEMHVALVKADWTNGNAEISQLLHAFGRSGVPLYVILPRGRADEPIVLPEVITSGIVLEELEAASRSKAATR